MLIVAVCLAAAFPARAQFTFNQAQKHVAAELITERDAVQLGEEFIVGLKLTHDEHWHTYWQYPGTGMPTTIEWTLPDGFEAGPIEWPFPVTFEAGGVAGYGYTDIAVLLTRIRAPEEAPDSITIQANVRWLECSDSCVPQSDSLTLTLQQGEGRRNEEHTKLIEAALKKIPVPLPVDDPPIEVKTRIIQKPEKADDPFEIEITLSAGQADFTPPFAFAPKPDDALELAFEPPVIHAAPDGARAMINVIGLLLELPESGLAGLEAFVRVTLKGGEEGYYHFPVRVFGEASAVQQSVPPEVKSAAVDDAPAPVEPTAPSAQRGLLAWLALAFLGGLILNIMPCVLPVISLKVFSFVRQAQESRGRLFFLGMMYVAGVLASFWALAGATILLKAGAGGASWGALFQFPAFVLTVTVIVFALGLNMLGVFEFQAPGGKAVQGLARLEEREGPLAAFSTGVLATILATPCSAPFLGTAVAFALAQPAGMILLIFTFIGLGLAFPFMLLSIFPGWTRHIPKPGEWMIRFKQAMGFLLLGTAAWTLSVYNGLLQELLASADAKSGLRDGVILLVAVGVVAWLYGSFINYRPSGKARTWALSISTALAAAGYLLLAHPYIFIGGAMKQRRHAEEQARIKEFKLIYGIETAAQESSEYQIRWLEYSPELLAALRRQNHLVFLDLTADWCLTCKANESVVLASDTVEAAFAKHKAVLVRGDFTARDPQIKRLLDEFQRPGVPVYAIYPPGGGAPELLPEVLTPSLVIAGLEKAAGA
ncbi:thioredoxin family protein [Candidatus Sumerlaeota bacterium]|nr:thioredoxin family protein [Candidatus Sumerlaeota bacterium]